MRSPETASRRAIRLRRLSLAATYAMLLAGAAIMVVPFAYSVLTSLKSPEQFASTDPLAFPAPVTGENYSALFSGDRDFTVPLAVTVQVVAVLTVGQVVCSVLAAYAFARLRFPGRRALFWAYVATLMVPPIVTVIPLFSMLSQLGLRNTFAGLVAPFLLGSPYAIFLLRQNFQAIPPGGPRRRDVGRGGPLAHAAFDRAPDEPSDPGRPDAHHRRLPVERLPLAVGHRAGPDVERSDGRHPGAAGRTLRELDARHGGDHRRPRAARRPLPGIQQADRRSLGHRRCAIAFAGTGR